LGSEVQTLPDPVAEGNRIAAAGAGRGLSLRLLGGVAVAVLCPSSGRPPLQRTYGDIDFATAGSSRKGVIALMEELGYEGDREFNMLHGHRRLYFWDEQNQRQVDVFVDEANLCHRVELKSRIEVMPLTLSLADLTVLKLQVVETNEKDYLDLCAIFADHELTDDDVGINWRYIAELTAADWGLWRTVGMVSARTQDFARQLPEFELGVQVVDRLGRLRSKLDTVPKGRRWKLRSRVGDRKRWYEIPEEAH
jgi:hypothetical protein